MSLTRCPWARKTDIEAEYHDTEWGRPVFDDQRLFEFLILESAQAGLSWLTILRRREGYRERFYGFDAARVAAMSEADIAAALTDTGIIRNRGKVAAAVSNARIFLELQAAHGSFARYIWDFIDGRPIVNRWDTMDQVPATTPVSDTIAKDLRTKGFRFFGSTICYAHMQATGMVNDHLTSCPQHAQCCGHETPPWS
ncbi:MAG: DNA-3-methyladenine glycosylase I [Oceanococcaceae bacterium]